MPETQYVERTVLARQRSSLAMLVISLLMLTHADVPLGASAALLIAAAGLAARSPGALTAATGLAAVFAALIVIA
jgi:hypothetical protein